MHDVCFAWMKGDCPSNNKAAVQKGSYKLVMNQVGMLACMHVCQACMLLLTLALPALQGSSGTVLYDLSKDPSETTDIASANTAKVAELMAIVYQYNSTGILSQDRSPPVAGADPRLHGGVWMPWE